MVSFICQTSHFMDALRSLRQIYKNKKLQTWSHSCEITLVDGLVTLAIPGAIFHFKATTKGTAKATLPFSTLFSIVDHHGVDILKVEFYQEALRFASVQVEAKTCFFRDDKILRTIVLPNNYNTRDLLLLRKQNYTREELEFNNLLHVIEAAERNMYYYIRRSASFVKQYGVSPKEIKKLVEEKLEVKLELDEQKPQYLYSNSKDENMD